MSEFEGTTILWSETTDIYNLQADNRFVWANFWMDDKDLVDS